MRDTIRVYIEELFESAPRTRRAIELKDELIANLTERYDDLVADGMDPQVAYATVINGIGDVNELISTLQEQDVLSPVREQQQKQKSALLVSAAVAIYILSLIPPLFMDSVIGKIIMLIMIACATGVLVYNNMTKVRYRKYDDSLVEEFKEWRHASVNRRAVLGTVHSLIWTVAVIVFLLLGFLFGIWYIAWIVFLVAFAISQIARLLLTLYGDDGK